MSYMFKILEMLGDKEFLLINEQMIVEGGGKYKNYHYLIVFNNFGIRCAYVELPLDHPINQCLEEYPDFEVHGGVTFFGKHELIIQYMKDYECKEKWIGFDGGHYYDIIDTNNLIKYFNKNENKKKIIINLANYLIEKVEKKDFIERSIKNKKYMELECYKLIDQLIKLEKIPDK